MIKSILISIDESVSSKATLEVGLDLAKNIDARVKGLYVEDVMRLLEWQPTELIGAAMGASSGMPEVRPTEEQVEIEKEFVRESTNLRTLFEEGTNNLKLKSSFTISRGKVDEQIINFSRSVDLVVIGRRGKTYPETSKEPGPVAESLLRHTTRPVLLVPQGSKLTSKVLISYDGGSGAQRALREGAALASLQNSKVEIVSVLDETEKAKKLLEEAREFLIPYNLNVAYTAASGSHNPWKAIMQRAKDFNSGLVVIGAFGENKIMEMIFGSTTRHVLMEAKCPVLLCR